MKKKWTDKEIEYIIRAYPETLTKNIAEKLGVPIKSVYNKAKSLGLKKSDKFFKKEASGRLHKLSESGKAYRFKKGHVPVNKGKKLPEYVKEKIRQTMFKKGHRPKNTLYDGAISLRKNKRGDVYKMIRVGLGKWVMLHVYNWEQIHGPVPEGKILVSIDGNTLNCDPSNWMTVTRAEHLERNSGRKNLEDKYVKRMLAPRDRQLYERLSQSHELIELKRTELKLRRTINECS